MRSDSVKTGSQQAPHRSLFNALGLTKEEMERPLVGIVSSYNEIVPGHMNLDEEADAVEAAVQKVLTDGYRTGDIMSEGCKAVGTKEMGDLIAAAV